MGDWVGLVSNERIQIENINSTLQTGEKVGLGSNQCNQNENIFIN